jgi:hypothetical protein
MIRGIQINWKYKKGYWDSGSYYIKHPSEIVVDCTKGNMVISAKELEEYLKNRNDDKLKS